MNNNINVVLAADDNYAQHVAVVSASILANTEENIVIHLLSDCISQKKISLIDATIRNLGGKLCVYEIGFSTRFNNLFTSGHISRATYFRLDIANLLDEEISKAIYMDVDLLVLKNIKELWNINMNNYSVAAVPDYGIMASNRLMKQKHRVLGLGFGKQYFNAGVLVVDLEQWRKHDYAKQVIELAASGDLPHHDQDAMNKVFMDNWQVVPLKWNVIPPVFNLFSKILFNSKFREKAIEARKDKGIMHYAGRYKPWEFKTHSGFNDMYYHYLKMTAFADVKMPQPGKNMKGKSITRQMARLKIADFWQWILG